MKTTIKFKSKINDEGYHEINILFRIPLTRIFVAWSYYYKLIIFVTKEWDSSWDRAKSIHGYYWEEI